MLVLQGWHGQTPFVHVELMFRNFKVGLKGRKKWVNTPVLERRIYSPYIKMFQKA
ncbi:hypothetical protein [Candidatus Kuenenia sp.]|uniref:hypothetical protein n=1 Tax=Candidatus Kuenenia sp. TaxID=2499824 RepID=UPI0032208022